MNVFISGGCKNGKSFYAQRIAKETADKSGKPLYYLATMRPADDEDRARIKRHIAERDGWGFITVEQPTDICARLALDGVILLDSVTALLANEMFLPDGSVDRGAPERVAKELVRFAEETGNTVFVSDYIYSDAARYDELTEEYRKGLARIDRALAAVCGKVIEVAYSQIIEHK